MQNKFVGDVGDYAKFGLLRRLCGQTSPDGEDALSLGLVWYMRHDERHGTDRNKVSGDGSYTSYLELTKANIKEYGDHDSELWAKLGVLVAQGRRCTHCAEVAKLLPDGTAYYSPMLTYVPGNSKRARDARTLCRTVWFEEALRKTAGADLVFLDPDNGIAPNENLKHREHGPKHAYLSDLQAIWGRGQSLVIYQHMVMNEDAQELAERKCHLLRTELEGTPEAIPLYFNKGTARLFLVVPQPERRGLMERRINGMLEDGWDEHFVWI